jgi:hypothetical protein
MHDAVGDNWECAVGGNGGVVVEWSLIKNGEGGSVSGYSAV